MDEQCMLLFASVGQSGEVRLHRTNPRRVFPSHVLPPDSSLRSPRLLHRSPPWPTRTRSCRSAGAHRGELRPQAVHRVQRSPAGERAPARAAPFSNLLVASRRPQPREAPFPSLPYGGQRAMNPLAALPCALRTEGILVAGNRRRGPRQCHAGVQHRGRRLERRAATWEEVGGGWRRP